MAYEPKYVTLGDIPVQIPDDYSPKEKRDALEYAETLIEVDLNEGETFSENRMTPVHEAAIKQKATCELAKGSEHPDDTALGDLEDSGSTKAEYAAQAFCDRYDEIIGKIRSSLESETTGPYVYTTSPSDELEDWRDLQDELDLPLSEDA
jgi:hypothetical protein